MNMNKVIEDLISEAQVEVMGNNPFNGSPEFLGYEIDSKELIKLTVQTVLFLISAEQDKAEQNWQCKDGIHISWKIKDLVKDTQ
jgi:hypothetical protein